jgi:hypothetical protein
MPITFGAVGDIISVCLLVKDLVEVLDKARGSKAEYQAAIRELWILDRTLLEIGQFNGQYGDRSTPELRGLCETAKRAVARCQGLVTAFLERIGNFRVPLKRLGDRMCSKRRQWQFVGGLARRMHLSSFVWR